VEEIENICERKKREQKLMMKHKRHQKDRRDKSEKVRHEDHRYYKAEYCAKSDYKQYTMKHLSENCGENEPKKLIIYIVIEFLVFWCGRMGRGSGGSESEDAKVKVKDEVKSTKS
jgi:hypothetical protein